MQVKLTVRARVWSVEPNLVEVESTDFKMKLYVSYVSYAINTRLSNNINLLFP